MSSSLKSFGFLGKCVLGLFGFVSNAAGLGITISGVSAVLVLVWSDFLTNIQKPFVYCSAGIFLFSLWTYIGVRILWREGKPILVKTIHEYAYGIMLDGGLGVALGKFPATHPTHPNGNAIVLTCTYRNVSAGPLRMKIEHVRVILNGRTNEEDEVLPDLKLGRLSAIGIKCGGVPRADSDVTLVGTLNVKFVYGHPDGKFERRCHIKSNIQVAIRSQTDGSALVAADGNDLVITDEPYIVQ